MPQGVWGEGLLGAFWGFLGASWRHLGASWGASWGLLVAFGEPSWGLLGTSWGGRLEISGRVPVWAPSGGRPGAFLGRLGVLFGCLGALLGRLGAIFRAPWGVLSVGEPKTREGQETGV